MRRVARMSVLLLIGTFALIPSVGAASGEAILGNVPESAVGPWGLQPLNPPWEEGVAAVGPASCPCPGGTPEAEADCGLDKAGNSSDNTNGGCNFEPFLSTPIACGETICATTGVSSSGRDTDWFSLVLAQETEVTVSLTPEFDVGFWGILNTAGGPPNCDSPGTDWGSANSPLTCNEGSDTRTLSAGTWWIFVAAGFGDLATTCGTPYTLSVECPLFSDGFESGDVCNWSYLPGASNTCLTCGNHVVEAGETCDDGNLSNDDGCSSTCQTEFCGDGIQQSGEECDDGTPGGDGCNAFCEIDSCVGYCGSNPPSSPCYCDESCLGKGDCCFDACTECAPLCDPPGIGSCEGFCDKGPPDGSCYCDDICVECGDCCADVCAVCGYCSPTLHGPRSEASGSAPLFLGDCRRGAPD